MEKLLVADHRLPENLILFENNKQYFRTIYKFWVLGVEAAKTLALVHHHKQIRYAGSHLE